MRESKAFALKLLTESVQNYTTPSLCLESTQSQRNVVHDDVLSHSDVNVFHSQLERFLASNVLKVCVGSVEMRVGSVVYGIHVTVRQNSLLIFLTRLYKSYFTF